MSKYLLGLFLLDVSVSQALPEYALQNNTNRCTTCHTSPVGGGPRNLFGKAIGARGFQLSPLSQQDTISAQLYMLHYSPEKKEGRSGAGIMAANISGNLPVTAKSENTLETRLIATANIGGFQTNNPGRETYLRVMTYEDGETSPTPQYYIIGRFQSPFGLMTDEHRTYTKLQSQQTWNDFDMGVLVSANPVEELHYDIGIVNGAKSGASGLTRGGGELLGYIGNLRWFPKDLKFMFGYSGSVHQVRDNKETKNPQASVLYIIADIHPLLGLSGNVKLEYERARFWNSQIGEFITSTSYRQSVANSESEGWSGEINFDLWLNWQLNFKYDRLTLDRDYPADFYERQGLGLRWFLAPNMSVLARLEKALATHPSEDIQLSTAGWGQQDAFLGLLKLSL